MRLGKIGWLLAVMGVVMAGCSTGDDADDLCTRDADCPSGQQCEQATGQCEDREPRNLLCATSADCLSSELCHPTAGVCVQTCESSADCPDATKTCAAMSANDSRRICHCSTDLLCNLDRPSPDLVCSDLEGVCRPKCTADVDCGSSRTCNAGTGQCEERGIERCTSSADCLASELCHPTAGVCVRTCASGADCPDASKTCAELSATDSRKVCQCSTDALCNLGSGTTDLVCADLGSVCVPACTADADCAPGRCNTATGQCQEDSTGLSCAGEGQSTCDYGTRHCASGQCAPLPVPGCINYTNFPNKGDLGDTGPILYGARLVSAVRDTSYCPEAAPKRVKVAVSAYSYQPFPPSKSALSGIFYVNAAGARLDAAVNLMFPASEYVVSGANRERAEMPLSLCFPESSREASIGVYFTNGNFLCFQANF